MNFSPGAVKQVMTKDPPTPAKSRPVRWLLLPLVLGVLLGVAYYLFLYVPSRNEYFTERAFRRLEVLGEQVENLIAGLDTAIGNAALTANPWETIKQVQPLEPFWSCDIPDDCPALPGTTLCAAWAGGGSAEANSTRLSSDAALQINPTLHRSARLYFASRPQLTSPPSLPPTPSASPAPTSAPPNQATLCASADLGKLLQPLMGGTAFDDFDVFLASDDGTILFERGRSGLRLAQLPTGGQPNAGSTKAAGSPADEVVQGLPSIATLQSASKLTPVSLSGVRYNLFTQPVRLVVPARVSHGAGKPAAAGVATGEPSAQPVWVLGALVSQRQFATQNRTISFAALSYLPLVVILVLLAVPALKVWAMGPRDRLRTRDVYILAACLVAGVALLTVLMLSAYAYRGLVQSSDRRTQEFARTLCSNFHDEVLKAYDALTQFVTLEAQPQAVHLASLRAAKEAAKGEQRDAASKRLEEFTANPTLETWVLCREEDPELPQSLYQSLRKQVFVNYPFFELLTWSDPSGQQREKWTVQDVTTNLIALGDLASFQDAFSGRLWSFGGNPQAPREQPHARLALHVQISPNTGALVPTLSVPIPAKDEGGQVLGVATMVTHWGALLYPLRPPELGFAVIQNDGKVLFHSDPDRNLHENLFDESEPDSALRAAVFARRADFFNVDYNGRPQRLYAFPIEHTAWTLVVFRDKELLRTVQLEMLVPCVLLCLLYAGLYLLAAAVVRLLWPEERGAWLWPTQRRAGVYLQCSGVLLLVIAASAGTMWSCCPPVAAAVSILVAPASAAYGFLKLSDRGVTPPLLRILGYVFLSAAGAAVIGLAFASGVPTVRAAWVALALLMTLSLMTDVTGGISLRSRALLISGYVGMGMLVLVAVAVLPAVALFRDAYQQATEALVRLRQLQHAEARAERVMWLKDKYQVYLTPHFFGERLTRPTDNAIADDRDLLPVAEPLEHQDQGNLCARLPQGVTGPVMARIRPYSRESQQLRELIYDRASDDRWQWTANRSQGMATLSVSDDRFRTGDGALDTAGDSPCLSAGCCILQAVIPALSLSSRPLACFVVVVLLLVVGLALLALYALARAIFGLHVQGEVTVGDSAYLLTSCLVLQPERQLVERLKESAAVIDFHGDDPTQWRTWLAARVSGSPQRVVVDHFDYRIDDASSRRGKLELLEELVLNRSPIVTIASGWGEGDMARLPLDVRRDGTPVVVVSDIDPLPYFAHRLRAAAGGQVEDLTTEEITRWVRVCTRLGKIRAERLDGGVHAGDGLAPILSAECRWTEQLRGIEVELRLEPSWQCRSRQALIAHLGDLADAHYRDLWAQCTEEERLVLIHLAAEGFVNPRSWDTARRLMRRHLVRRAGALQLMNESFRRFVLAAEAPEQVREWEKGGGASLWAQWRTALLVLLLAGGVFLFVTQPDRLNTWLGFLGALAGGLATLTQIFGMFQSGKGEPQQPSRS